MREVEKFNKILEDPEELEKLQLKAELEDFKRTYNLERATPLKCPVCSQWGQIGGSLWISLPQQEGGRTFTCRKCKLTFRLELVGSDIYDFIQTLRERLR